MLRSLAHLIFIQTSQTHCHWYCDFLLHRGQNRPREDSPQVTGCTRAIQVSPGLLGRAGMDPVLVGPAAGLTDKQRCRHSTQLPGRKDRRARARARAHTHTHTPVPPAGRPAPGPGNSSQQLSASHMPPSLPQPPFLPLPFVPQHQTLTTRAHGAGRCAAGTEVRALVWESAGCRDALGDLGWLCNLSEGPCLPL